MSKKSKNYRAIGLMSGTSLDGLDIVLATFEVEEDSYTWFFDIERAVTVEYPAKMEQQLRDCIGYNQDEIKQLDEELGVFFGTQVRDFLAHEDIATIDFIASHGHTVRHEPEHGCTIQIGSGAKIHELTGIKVINDFRSEDVRMGGQGAPLVPIGDMLLFSEYTHCLNLGGIANISFDDAGGVRRAFDICGCNLILNGLAQKKGLPYDENGFLAANGTVCGPLLEQLNTNPYYRHTGPKSLGKEHLSQFDQPLIESMLNDGLLSIEDALCTYCHHIGEQIIECILQNTTETSPVRLLITGGGAWNNFLINECIKPGLCGSGASLHIPDRTLLEFKEALIFALLGVLKLRNETNVLSSVTGATHDSVAGTVYS